MKIHVDKLKKTFDVKTTNKVLRSVYQFQLDLAERASSQGKDGVGIFSDAIASIDLIEDFLVKILGLSKQDAEKLDDYFESEDVQKMANYVASRLMGMSDEEIKESTDNAEETDSKK
ncbi:phage tail tube assembly chaperone [Limosilactobacillus reuteri]|uniref:phage tail tube assembly chaperone n=1 Tax=Limosilactobacillus reuteri TaxID=1598 RepID=UPI000A2D681B|nr:phage tail tube assembly chaperone [Limosilactobacillus reuteri]OTA88459.1 hypothetical protein BHL84_00255 [Limosilactobacillus reuteri]